jgi:hypothetical protein
MAGLTISNRSGLEARPVALRNIAWMLEQIAEYVSEISLVEGEPVDAALVTALCDRTGIKLAPPPTGGPCFGSCTQAGGWAKLHAEPIG